MCIVTLAFTMRPGDSKGCIKVWNLAANACSCELVPEVDVAVRCGRCMSSPRTRPVRSLSVATDGSLVCAANDKGTCYVWRIMRNAPPGANFDPLYKLRAHDCTLCLYLCDSVPLWFCTSAHTIHAAYILKCLISPDVRQLATASSDKTIKLWNLDTFSLDRTLTGACCGLVMCWSPAST